MSSSTSVPYEDVIEHFVGPFGQWQQKALSVSGAGGICLGFAVMVQAFVLYEGNFR